MLRCRNKPSTKHIFMSALLGNIVGAVIAHMALNVYKPKHYKPKHEKGRAWEITNLSDKYGEKRRIDV